MKPLYPDFELPPFVIVDDCEDDIFLLRHRLRDGGITNPIFTFNSPAPALDFLRDLPADQLLPQYVFADIRMPVGCGFELIAAIRDNPGWDRIKVVVVSMSNQTEDLQRALELGANAYLIKFPPSDLLVEFLKQGPWFETRRPVRAATTAILA